MVEKKLTMLVLSGLAAGIAVSTWFCGGAEEATTTTTVTNAEQSGGTTAPTENAGVSRDAAVLPINPDLARTTPPGLPPVPSPPCTSCPPELDPRTPGRMP